MEEQEASRCKARLQHLVQLGVPQKDQALDWNRNRIDRLLADHMLRCGFLESATHLVAEAGMQVCQRQLLLACRNCVSTSACEECCV